MWCLHVIYNDVRESIPELVSKNNDENSLMSDTLKISCLMQLKHHEDLNIIEIIWYKR